MGPSTLSGKWRVVVGGEELNAALADVKTTAGNRFEFGLTRAQPSENSNRIDATDRKEDAHSLAGGVGPREHRVNAVSLVSQAAFPGFIGNCVQTYAHDRVSNFAKRSQRKFDS